MTTSTRSNWINTALYGTTGRFILDEACDADIAQGWPDGQREVFALGQETGRITINMRLDHCRRFVRRYLALAVTCWPPAHTR